MKSKHRPYLRTAIRTTLACALCAALGGISVSPARADTAPSLVSSKAPLQQLAGTYSSIAAEDWGRGAFGHRTFSFERGRWNLRFTLALDPGLQNRVFEFRTLGSYQVLRESKAVRGAFDALFLEDRKYVTLLTDNAELTKAFGLAECGLVPGVEKDISESGCARWKPVSVCREDHDLLALDTSGYLYFGVRPEDNDMCTPDKRPMRLIYPVAKRPAA
jgi:hypothetical protein